jgi:WD40 repeat protein/DNA-binding CsgD family transcriptional regulator
MSEIPEDFLKAVAAQRNVSEAELAALSLALTGQKAEAIAKSLQISAPAVRKRLGSVYDKFDIPGSGPGKLEVLRSLLLEQCQQTSCDRKRRDWGEAVDISAFYGRTEELGHLEKWIVEDGCRLVALLGMGGIGKTSLSVILARQIKEEFAYVIWRSLRNAPPVRELLADLVKFFSNGEQTDVPEDVSKAIALLIGEYLQKHRCLLVLDNVESVLCAGDRAGEYRQGYENYGELLRRLGETYHRSCILLTSREKPKEIALLEGKTRPVRVWQLTGLTEADCQKIFQAEGFSESESGWKKLIQLYEGNPLALKIAATTIQELFSGNIDEFLEQGTIAFGDIRDLLEQQFNRLSPLEQEIMYWLAIERDPVSISELRDDLVVSPILLKILEALESLGRRFLIERVGAGFTLQNVAIEYLYNRLTEQVCQEITTGKLDILHNYALLKATANDSIRNIQERLIIKPLKEKLLAYFKNSDNLEIQLNRILSDLRDKSRQRPGYAGGNLLNLRRHLKNDLSGGDFSSLTIRQAYLQGAKLQNVNFAHSDLSQSVFTQTFGSVFSVAFSPDGKCLAAGDSIGEIRLWRVIDGTQLATFQGHVHWIWSVAFSPDGQILASGSASGEVRLWQVDTGQCLYTLLGHTGIVWSIAFSRDGQTLASSGDDGKVRLWDTRKGRCLDSMLEHDKTVRTVAFSPDGETLASGSDDYCVRLWDVRSGACLSTLEGHSRRIWSVAFSPDGQILASGSSDRTVKLWSIRDGQYLKTLSGHVRTVRTVAFSPDGETLASGSNDHSIRLWNVENGQCLRTRQEHTNWVWSVAYSPDGETLASGSEDQSLRLWDVRDGRCLKTFQSQSNRILSVAYSPDGQTLASSSEDRALHLWDVRDGRCLKIWQEHANRVRSVAFSPDGQILASGSDDYSVRLWNIGNGQCLKTLQEHTDWVRSVVFSPDGQILASGSDDYFVKLWDIRSGQCLQTLGGHTNRVWSVAFSPDGRTLASSGEDRSVRLWDIRRGQCLNLYSGHNDWVSSVAFSPDGQTLVSSSVDQTVRVWDIKTGQCSKVLKGHTAWVPSVAFSPDGQTLASGSVDRTVRLWDVRTGQCLKRLSGHENWVWSVAFGPDGQTLVSGSSDETLRLWEVETGDCLNIMRLLRPYEGMNITGTKGLTKAQRTTLKALGAVED